MPVEGEDFDFGNGDVAIAAITSCTNTSNPSVLIGAGLVARKAREKGLQTKPWVKTSLAPGSQVVTDYLNASGLSEDLNALGFDLVGYGCTTCIGNSGPLPEAISKAINEKDLVAVSVLSGNRNFEGRVSPDCRANYLASPPLVVAYALKGTVRSDLMHEPIGTGSNGEPVYLKDIWPSNKEIRALIDAHVHSDMFRTPLRRRLSRRRALAGDQGDGRRHLRLAGRVDLHPEPALLHGHDNDPDAAGRHRAAREPWPCSGIRSRPTTSRLPARSSRTARLGAICWSDGVSRGEFNSYGARRGNHEVMMRGTFANIRIRNRMLDNVEGGFTRYAPTGETMPIYDAAMLYKQDDTPLVVLAGKEYGTGSSRDWAAKGTVLLGVRTVIAESFERIHRSNLVGMGVLPLQFRDGENAESLGLDGSEKFSVKDVAGLQPRQDVEVVVRRQDKSEFTITARCRIDTYNELEYFRSGGILHYVLRKLAAA